jgi:hypothetical protein
VYPLQALANGVEGGNGVFKYGPSSFPTQSYAASNYWVDLVFEITAPVQARSSAPARTSSASTPAAAASPSPSPSPSPTPAPSPTPTPLPSPTPSPSPRPTASPSPSPVPTPSPSASPAASPSPTPGAAPASASQPSPAPSPTPTPRSSPGRAGSSASMEVIGMVTVDGTPAAPGAVLQAYVGRTLCGETTVTAVEGGRNFRLVVSSAAQKAGCGTDGTSVTFTVDDERARPGLPFESGATISAVLTVP